MRNELADYYERRAPDYDAVYGVPDGQEALGQLRFIVGGLFVGQDVLEVAAGTGYWTEAIAPNARTVLATDYNPAPLAIAAARAYPGGNVRFDRADAFALDAVAGEFTGAFAGFWWSHVLLADIDRFLSGLCARVRPGSVVAAVDNRFVEGRSFPIVRTDPTGDTYQRRVLRDGTSYEILKNFPTRDELLSVARRHGGDPDVVELDAYWLLTLTT